MHYDGSPATTPVPPLGPPEEPGGPYKRPYHQSSGGLLPEPAHGLRPSRLARLYVGLMPRWFFRRKIRSISRGN